LSSSSAGQMRVSFLRPQMAVAAFGKVNFSAAATAAAVSAQPVGEPAATSSEAAQRTVLEAVPRTHEDSGSKKSRAYRDIGTSRLSSRLLSMV
jgi:hypothetical protein